jgi:DNA gyrase subunit A
MVPVGDFSADAYLMMATKNGFIKKTHLSSYSNPRRGGIIAINLREDDKLIESRLTSGNDDVILAKKKGKAIRFSERDVRKMGRATQGVKGVTLDKDDEVVDMVVVKRKAEILAVTVNGFGKRTRISDFRNIHRGGKGVVCIPTAGRNGDLVCVKEVIETDEVMMITRNGLVIRCPVKGIPVLGRPAKGVRVISLNEGDSLVDVALIVGDEEEGAEVEAHMPAGTEGEEAEGPEEIEGKTEKKEAAAKEAKAKAKKPAAKKAKVKAKGKGKAAKPKTKGKKKK